jgi:hypothetical protein
LYKISSKWIKDLHIPETLILEENMEKILEDIGMGTAFLSRTAIV